MLPTHLNPTTFELFHLENLVIEVPKCIISFDKWLGEPVKETFGGKTVLNIDGKPMFAELAIANYFTKVNWEARWVETYGKKEPICLVEWKDDKYKNQVHVPFSNLNVINILSNIAKINNNSYAGCWDVVAYKNEQIIFAESKRSKKDSIRNSQINWLKSALAYGLKPENLLVVEWEVR